ncbi:hypothetical protein [Cellulomonas sp. Marseille-Q8402]
MSGSSAPRPSSSTPSGPPGAAPTSVRVLTVLVLVQALALVAAAVALVVGLARGTSMPGPVLFLVVLALGMAALLAGAGRALLQGRRWGRAPVMTVQILLVVLAVGWLGVEVAAWSVGVLVLAVLTGALLLVPAVVTWTTADAPR